MRTVSFSSDPVHDLLTSDFVCYSLNTEGDPSAGSSMAHAPTDTPGHCTQGIGKQNVQCLFLTPDGEIFHTASGFQSPAELSEHLETASTLFAAIQENPDRADRIVHDLHQERLDELQTSDADARRMIPGSFAQFMTQIARRGNRGGRFNPTTVDGIFDLKTQDAAYNDNRYMVEHPLITLEEFQRNPRELVGHERTAFASVGNGGASGGRIGQ